MTGPHLNRPSSTASAVTITVFTSVCSHPLDVHASQILIVWLLIDPTIGEAAGFGGVILHGLSTFGFGARAVVSAVGGGKPDSLKYFGVRFTAPVKPGDALETSIWEVGPGPNGTTEVAFITKDATTGKVCLGAGVAYVIKTEKSKL